MFGAPLAPSANLQYHLDCSSIDVTVHITAVVPKHVQHFVLCSENMLWNMLPCILLF